MSVRKRNEFLEGDGSDEEADTGYDSEAAEESKGALTGRSSKRRRVEAGSDEDVSAGSEDEDERDAKSLAAKVPVAAFQPDRNESPPPNDDVDERFLLSDDADKPSPIPALKSSAPKLITAVEKAARKSGVIYISRVPPFMKPQTLKHLLTPHAPSGLGRIFLTPETAHAHARRVKSGGNKKKSFTDGWVEFASKREAKAAAQLLNGNIIGGKKGSFYHDDLWNMKYLRGFKWSHLTEQIASENAARASRMREEVRRTKVENRRFAEDVERGKMLEGMEAKRRAKGAAVEGDVGEGGDGEEGKGRRRQKEFKQRKVRRAQDEGDRKSQEVAPRMGSKIFGS